MIETLTLEEESGLRLNAINNFSLQLASGSAEILGSELMPETCYEFKSGSKVVLFSWSGCTLDVQGQFSSEEFKASNSTVGRFLVIHNSLNKMRENSKAKFRRGPRVMVVGSTDMGKSSLCKVLCNYASRSGWDPVLVDLDLGQNEISLPGTISAAVITKQIDIQKGITSAPFKICHFGYTTPDKNRLHYKHLIRSMAQSINHSHEKDKKLNHSGIIINTCGWVTGFGYEVIMTTAHEFEVDMVVVISNELLHVTLKKELPDFVKVTSLPRPSEVVPRSKDARFWKRSSTVRNYFHGPDRNLTPRETTVPFHQVEIFRIKKQHWQKHLSAVPVEFDEGLERHVASVCRDDPRCSDFTQGDVSDFVVIARVDTRENRLTLLSRSQLRDFSSLLLMDDVLYQD